MNLELKLPPRSLSNLLKLAKSEFTAVHICSETTLNQSYVKHLIVAI